MKVALLIPDNRDEFKDWLNPEPHFGPAPSALLEGFAQIPDREIHVVCCLHRPLPSPEKIGSNIWYHSLVVSKWGWRLAYAGCVWAIRQKLRAIRPDIVHGQGTERYAAVAAAYSGQRNVVTVHGNMRAVRKALGAPLFSPWALSAYLESLTLRATEGVLCLTSYAKAQAGDLPAKTWIVPNAVDSSFFEVERNPSATPLIFCPADATPYKNQIRLIRALDGLNALRPLKLVLAGKTPTDSTYAKKILAMCAERSWCEHLGLLDKSALQKMLGQATVLVLPSLEDNCPMAILEAMAAGVPVAASRIGGIPDLIEDGANGILFDPLDEEAIRTAVETLLRDSGKAQRLSETARERAQTWHLPIAVARRHLEIYRELLSGRL